MWTSCKKATIIPALTTASILNTRLQSQMYISQIKCIRALCNSLENHIDSLGNCIALKERVISKRHAATDERRLTCYSRMPEVVKPYLLDRSTHGSIHDGPGRLHVDSLKHRVVRGPPLVASKAIDDHIATYESFLPR